MTAEELQDVLLIRAEDFRTINRLIDWFESLPVGHSRIDEIMDCRRKLSAISIRLSIYVGQLARAANEAEGLRKIRFAKLRELYKKEFNSVAAAESRAEEEISDLRQRETEAQGRYQSGRLLADSISQVLNALAGELNFLIRDKNTSGKTQEG
jgi:hypothetical protein